MDASELVLGVDGGGSKTLAILAPADGTLTAVGRGEAGPSNPRAVGWPTAQQSLRQAIRAAFGQAGVPEGPVAAACLALAGVGRDDERQRLNEWAVANRLAERLQLVHDALPILAAGTPDGWGIAFIAGTGSLAFGQDRRGNTARAGGWGYLLGDEGSGYWLALEGLRAVARAADGREPETRLQSLFLQRLQLSGPQQLIGWIYDPICDRRALAALAPLVIEAAATSDSVAISVVDRAATALAGMVAAVARSLSFQHEHYPLALAGGVLVHSDCLRESLQRHLRVLGQNPAQIQIVPEPAVGALVLARQSCATARFTG